VVARLEIDYRAELFYPGQIDIGTRVLSIGRTSFRVGQGIFKGDTCAATAETVLVLMDDATRKAKPLTPQLRTWLEARLAR
jgi:acyl-CoA thioester hydrolase